MRRGLLVLLVVAGLTLPAGSALAAELPAEFTSSCPAESPGGSYGGVRICSGGVTSFDGAILDVDLTQPMHDTGGSHPLIVMLHGFGNDKHEWESTTDDGDGADKSRWNNRWFAKHGYYVLTYTARGFSDDGPSGDNQPPTPATPPNGSEEFPGRGTINLKSRDFEIRDTQWLAALVAEAYSDVDPNRVAVTGGSYGGIESWLQASQATWTFPNEQTNGELPVLNLQVAIPKYPSTDLAYSLAPNGHGGGPSDADIYESSQGRPTNDMGDGYPIGVPKESYIDGLFALGATKGTFESGTTSDFLPCTYGNCEGNHSIPLWRGRTFAAEPTTPEDALLRQIRRGLTEFRGAYYQNEGWGPQTEGRKVAVYSIQGWTDDLFPAVESFRMFKYLKRLDPRWPVEVAVADVGHSRAQNKPETWHRLNAQAFQWLQSQINGSREQQTTVSSEPTVCDEDAPAQRLTATTPEGLANGTLSIHYPGGATVNPNPLEVVDPNGKATDAIAGPLVQPGERCRHSAGVPATGGYTEYSPPLTSSQTFVGLGSVTVPYRFTGTSATLNARLFDRAPDGSELLMTRGTYRLENPGPDPDPPTGVLELPFYGNHWRLRPGHQIRLDLTQIDIPTYHPSHLPSSIEFEQGVTLTLPTREAGETTLGG
jgi:pimeloyl-ACP methyl ester carboxylesterase